MTEFLKPEQAQALLAQREKELSELRYEVCDKTKNILEWAIQDAIRNCKAEVSIVIHWYAIEEWSVSVKWFLEQEWYKNVMIEETGYSCFNNNRGQTQIVFSI